MSDFFTGLNPVGLPPGSTHVFQCVLNASGTTWDVMDTRTKAIVTSNVALDVAQADAIARNALLDAI